MRNTKKPARKSAAKDAMMKQLMAKINKQDIPPMTLQEIAKEKALVKVDERMLAKYADRSETYKKYLKNQIQKAAEAREKERIKKAQMVIKPRMFTGPSGGRLTANGKIYDKNFKEVLYIDKSGNIKNKMGMKIGKYDHNSAGGRFQLERLVEKYCAKANNPGGGIWGKADGSGGNGFWG